MEESNPSAGAGFKPRQLPLAMLAYFLSGFSALMFETLWFRVAGRMLGSSVYSAAAVLTAFMSGLALGAAWIIRHENKLSRPFRWYLYCELLIGGGGLLAVYLPPYLSPALGPLLGAAAGSPPLLAGLRFSLAFCAFLPPAFGMGLTLPLLQQAVTRHDPDFLRAMGRLYGWNTLGAVAGALAAEYVFITYFGINGAAVFSAGLNWLAAGLIYVGFLRQPHILPAAETPSPRGMPPLGLLAGPFLTGFTLLALEVVWFRLLLLSQSGSSSVFAVMLSLILAGLALGGFIASRLKPAAGGLDARIAYFCLAAACCVAVSFRLLAWLYEQDFKSLSFNPRALIYCSALLMTPTACLSGILFPLFGQDLRQRLASAASAGWLTLVNTLGAALGSAAATFILLPHLGVEYSLLALACVYLLAALPRLTAPSASAWPRAAGCAALIATLGLFPYSALPKIYAAYGQQLYPGEKPLAVKEGLNETIQYFAVEKMGQPLWYRLATNSLSMSGTSFPAQRYMKLFVYLPHLLRDDLQDVLQISYGVGMTAEAVVSLDSLRRYDVVDISRDILDLSQIVHQARGVHPLQDPRTRVHIEDGRFFLQTETARYDLITGEPPPPKTAGVVNLYTQEYFQLIFDRLKPNGMTSYWLPAHELTADDSLAIIKAFCNVFTHCSLWNGGGLEFILLGGKQAPSPMDPARWERLWRSPLGERLRDLGFEQPGQIAATYVAGSAELKRLTQNTAPLTDDFPHRLSPDYQNFRGVFPLYADLLDLDARRRNLANSEESRAWLDAEHIAAAAAYFNAEHIITMLNVKHAEYYRPVTDPDLFFWRELATELQSVPPLKVTPLLILGATPDSQKLLTRIPPNASPEYINESIAAAVVQRDYPVALAALAQGVRANPAMAANQTVLRLFCVLHALNGDLQAEQLALITGAPELSAWLSGFIANSPTKSTIPD